MTALLMVEDDANVADTLAERLRSSGFVVTQAATVAAARAALGAAQFQIALLDVGLPDGSGFDVARLLQASSPGTVMIFLTAHGMPEDRIHGLELGADDYVTKPFNFRELLLRVQNALKRASYLQQPGGASGVVRIGKASVDFDRFTAHVDGVSHPLTHKECAVLKLLVERAGTAVSRDEILDSAWSADEFPTQRTVDNFIVRLRRLVEADPANPRTIRSIRGVGYLFEANDD
ncbi:MAG TPA: response regulator transcription factor [Steroidobacteraceae bacterium]|jgi:two-component system alkaline phosphatase synthesis response regulator PhoP|nr:response regulator transcription factor [Steroidobacteraceae bacterium]